MPASRRRQHIALGALGLSELAFAAALLIAWRRRWPAWLCLGSMLVATAAVGVHSPRFFEAAFNPFSLNVAVASLAAIDLLVLAGVPSASRCLRRPASGEGMSSIYQRALGADFNRLHPQIQRRFGFSSSDGIASIGTRCDGRDLEGQVLHRALSARRQLAPHHVP